MDLFDASSGSIIPCISRLPFAFFFFNNRKCDDVWRGCLHCNICLVALVLSLILCSTFFVWHLVCGLPLSCRHFFMKGLTAFPRLKT